MLKWLKIKNLAVVEDVEIDFENGFNVISGETGAGKSVLINAVNLLFGKRTDKSLIRTDKDRCELSAEIEIPENSFTLIENFLNEYGIEYSENFQFIIRKVITRSSTKNFINDSTITLNALAKLGELLIDFHGPKHHQSFVKNSKQLQALDKFSNTGEQLKAVEESYKDLEKAENELKELENEIPDAIEAEHLKKIVNDIENVSPETGEDEDLKEKFSTASNAKIIKETAYNSKYILHDSENSVINNIADILKDLSRIEAYDEKRVQNFTQRLESISEEIKDISDELDSYSSEIDLDETEYAQLEERLQSINSLKRHYGNTIEEILETKRKARDKLEKINNYQAIKEDLENKLENAKKQYNKAANKLSEKRQKAAESFSEKTRNKLEKLGFLQAELSIDFYTSSPSPKGNDKIDFKFCPNPGEEKQSLKNIASSGEISRVMLAIKTVLSEADNTPMLIFDEIDANIGGEVANNVGAELHKLGKNHHILCISHLAQVASYADTHYMVDKSLKDNRTFTYVRKLSKEERIKEVSRMLGGGKAAKEHAKDMITQSD